MVLPEYVSTPYGRAEAFRRQDSARRTLASVPRGIYDRGADGGLARREPDAGEFGPDEKSWDEIQVARRALEKRIDRSQA